MIIVDFVSPNDIRTATITEAMPYNSPQEGRGEEVFYQEAGKLGVFSSRRGPIPLITAHSEEKSGLVTITEVAFGNEKIGTREIATKFRFDEKKGLYVGEEGGLYIGESPVNYNKLGVRANVTHPSDGPKNRVFVASLGYR